MKNLYKIIPLIFIFVLMFSVPVAAEDTPVYCGQINEENYVYIYNCEWFNRPSGVTNWTRINIQEYSYVSSGSGDKIALYESDYNTTYEPDYGKTLNCPYPQDSRYYGQLYESWNGDISSQGSNYITSVKPRLYQFVTSSSGDNYTVKFETNIPIFATQDECTQYLSGLIGVEQAVNYMKVYDCETERWVSVNIKNPDDEETDNGFIFDGFGDFYEDFKDFTEESSEYNDMAQKQEITENTNNPNDTVFGTILQAMVGTQHTENSISQQISNQLQYFSDQFFNKFAQYALNLMSDILSALNGLTGQFEGLIDITNQLYESGLDADGNFGVDNMYSYWLIPSEGYLENKLETFYFEKFGFIELGYSFLDSVQAALNQTDTVMPVFTTDSFVWRDVIIPSFTIDFSWYEYLKPYADPIVSAFCWIVFVWKVITGIPSLIRGGNVIGGVSDIQADIERSNIASSDAEKIARNFGWK